MLKRLYDATKTIEVKIDNTEDDALPELIVEDFDEEQIWQELELQNSARCKFLANTIKKFTKKDLVFLDTSDGMFIQMRQVPTSFFFFSNPTSNHKYLNFTKCKTFSYFIS